MHNTLPRIQAHRSNSTDSQALLFWRRGCANTTLTTLTTLHGQAWSRTKTRTPHTHQYEAPPPLPSFQHDILVPTSFEGVSCWAGERKREEASTRALFPEKHARKPRVSRRRRRPYTFLNLSSAGCRYRKKASGCFVHSYPSCTRSIALKGRHHSRRFGVSPKNAEKEGSHLFHPTLAWVADCVF